MSNILIIKHGSLGDLIQANGAIKDIKNNFLQKSFTTNNTTLLKIYAFMPYIDGVLIDRRLLDGIFLFV